MQRVGISKLYPVAKMQIHNRNVIALKTRRDAPTRRNTLKIVKPQCIKSVVPIKKTKKYRKETDISYKSTYSLMKAHSFLN